MTAAEAQAAIDRRAAVAGIAGAFLGELPLLWLIREALEEYGDMLDGLHGFVERGRPVVLLESGGHTFVLTPDNGLAILIEKDSFGSSVRAHETPNAALVLHDAVKADPVKAEKLLRTIESATQSGLR